MYIFFYLWQVVYIWIFTNYYLFIYFLPRKQLKNSHIWWLDILITFYWSLSKILPAQEKFLQTEKHNNRPKSLYSATCKLFSFQFRWCTVFLGQFTRCFYPWKIIEAPFKYTPILLVINFYFLRIQGCKNHIAGWSIIEVLKFTDHSFGQLALHFLPQITCIELPWGEPVP